MNAVYMGIEDKMMIFFDIDNTLVDYSKSEREAIRLITDKYGLKLEEYGKCWKGISERYFTKYLSAGDVLSGARGAAYPGTV